MHSIVSKPVNRAINIRILCLIIVSDVANRKGACDMERRFARLLVVAMAITVFYGVPKLRQAQTTYDVEGSAVYAPSAECEGLSRILNLPVARP